MVAKIEFTSEQRMMMRKICIARDKGDELRERADSIISRCVAIEIDLERNLKAHFEAGGYPEFDSVYIVVDGRVFELILTKDIDFVHCGPAIELPSLDEVPVRIIAGEGGVK